MIRELREDDRDWARGLLRERWGSERVVSRGRVHEPAGLAGFVAEWDGARVGLVTYRLAEGECEIVTLDSLVERHGVGTALIGAVRAAAAAAGARRLWLITTNDNEPAIRFYRSRGFEIVAVHEGAVDEARRRWKPEIPERGMGGEPIRDEVEMEVRPARGGLTAS